MHSRTQGLSHPPVKRGFCESSEGGRQAMLKSRNCLSFAFSGSSFFTPAPNIEIKHIWPFILSSVLRALSEICQVKGPVEILGKLLLSTLIWSLAGKWLIVWVSCPHSGKEIQELQPSAHLVQPAMAALARAFFHHSPSKSKPTVTGTEGTPERRYCIDNIER